MSGRCTTSIVFLLAVLLLGSGCAVDRLRLPQFDERFQAGDYEGARQIARKEINPNQPHRAVLWQLQKAKLDRMLGDFAASNAGFDRCEDAFRHYDLDNLAVAGGRTAVTLLANDSLRPYEGEGYDRVMVNTYKALNFAALGDHANARVEFNRALQRQDMAKERFAREIARTEREIAAREGGQPGAAGGTRRTTESPEVQGILAQQYSNLDRFQAYPDFVNPFTTYVAGLYFLLDRDFGKALDILKEAHGMMPQQAQVAADFASADARQPLRDRVYVLFENGLAPTRVEERLDLPLFLFTNRVLYGGIALPQLVPRSPAFPYLEFESSGTVVRTEALASMDGVVAAEFRKRLPLVVSRAVASAISKMAMQYVAQREGGDLLGLLVAGYSAMSTAADLRIWSALPKEFQTAVLPRPADGVLLLRRPGQPPVNISLPPCVNAIVCVRIPQAGAPPAVQIIAFN